MIKKIKENLKFIKIYDIIFIFIFILLLLPSQIYKIYLKSRNKKLWLITENGQTARDNGYHFFKYMREKHKEIDCYYVINKKSNDYKKVEKYGNIVQNKSIKHWIYYLSADYNISNQKNGNPGQALFYIIHINLNLFNNRVFLQHGITKDMSEWLLYKNTKFKYFICGAKKEYNFIKEKFGYPDGNVIYTGFPRFDALHDIKINKKQILIMPTWRNWLGRETNALGEKVIFEETDYYKNWNNVLNNEKFIKFIEDNNLKILFYPHMNMQKYLNKFKVKSENIEIVSMDTDIQTVLKESAIMITDYSSVYMDFAYMNKPVLYFQFDYEEYRKRQLQEGYFNYEKDGFGPVLYDIDALVNSFINIYNNGLESHYLERMKLFFEIRDQKNCERIYKHLS